jgi:hypothetical protein
VAFPPCGKSNSGDPLTAVAASLLRSRVYPCQIARTFKYLRFKSDGESDGESVKHFDLHPPEGNPTLVWAQRDSLASQLEDLLEEIQAFGALQTSNELGLDFNSLEALPTSLIEAWGAIGLTQKALADQLGVRPQQVQRNEATCYRNAISQGCLRLHGCLKRFIVSPEIQFPRSDSYNPVTALEGSPIPNRSSECRYNRYCRSTASRRFAACNASIFSRCAISEHGSSRKALSA